jgi:hypothetical protein
MKEELLQLWQVALEELSAGCVCAVVTTHDLQTVMGRLEHEGESFLTITLPAFAKDFEKSLDDGWISKDRFRGWSKHTSRDGDPMMPKFLSGFMSRVFNRVDGQLLDNPDPQAVFAIRQLTLMFGKMLTPCSDARVEQAMRAYVECEQELRRSDANLPLHLSEEFKDASLIMWGWVFQQVDEDVYNGNIIPKHGPGATADKLVGNNKFDQVEWTERLDRVFPFGDFLVPSPRHHFDVLSRVKFLEPGDERPVRVVAVPKTLKTPRIIAIEPTCMQYVQQGLMAKFVQYLESPSVESLRCAPFPNPGYGYVGFEDQTPNQRMAQQGSRDGSLATLDLSEASDRVSNQLVRLMLENFPNLAEGVDSCRSRKADVQGFGVIRLAKFASMGSALTFPIEAIVFSTVAMMGIAKELNCPFDLDLLNRFRGQVRVYGDDIIVPTTYAESVADLLETFGFRVNRNKSFWTGEFRESCGKEYFRGTDVSIVRCRRGLPSQLTHVEEIVSTVSMRNQLYKAGLWQTAKFLDDKLFPLLRGNYPIVEETSPVLGRHSICFGYMPEKISINTHAPLVKGYRINARIPASLVSGVGALLKCLLKQGEEPFADSRHLTRGGRPDAVNIKLGYGQPF